MSQSETETKNNSACVKYDGSFPETVLSITEFTILGEKFYMPVRFTTHNWKKSDKCLLDEFFTVLNTKEKTFEDAYNRFIINYLEKYSGFMSETIMLEFNKTNPSSIPYNKDLNRLKPIYMALIRDNKIDSIFEE